MRLSEEEFAYVVDAAIAALPEQFQEHLEHVVIDVEDRPDKQLARQMGVRPRELLGYYHGVPLTERSVEHIVEMPARIILFKRNIEEAGATRDEIAEQIRLTLLHEIGHHFGMDEEDLEELGYR